MKKTNLLLLFMALFTTQIMAQSLSYSMKNAHAHNDYLHDLPFYEAYAQHYGMIEADIFRQNETLVVAHEKSSIEPERTLMSLYIKPIIEQINRNNGKVYRDGQRLQLLIDVKEDGENALHLLEKQLKPYRAFFDLKNNPNAVQLVISGDMPKPENFDNFDDIFYFDGRPKQPYTPQSFARVPLISTSIFDFVRWNGKGLITAPQYAMIKNFVDSVHAVGKPVRFWGMPNSLTSYRTLIKLGVDYIGCDNLSELTNYLKTLNAYTAQPIAQHIPYLPTYHSDGIKKRSKNVILLIGDGMGLAQIYSGITANGGRLNWTMLKNLGFSNTNSADSFCTDSAAGATAFSTGEKTNNRYIGMNTQQQPLENISEVLSKHKINVGLVVSEDITGATPASFYAHQPERDWSQLIAEDLIKSPVSLVIGAGRESFKKETLEKLTKDGQLFTKISDLSQANTLQKTFVLVDKNEVKPKHEGRGEYLSEAFDTAVKQLEKTSPNGFFMMVEGSQIDWGGHANQLNYVANEMLDFDKVIGKALAFADKNGETTIIITADHETGGLSLLEGDLKTGKLQGNFSTTDHSGVMVPVAAYGTNAQKFMGFYENNTIFEKILQCFRLK